MSTRETIRVLLSEETILQRIQELGEQISKEYANKQLHLVCVLKGAAFFACKLAQCISVPVSMDFLTVSSYGQGTKSQGVVKMIKDLQDSLHGKDVLVVEDIVDSGRTLTNLLQILREREPASLRFCTLLDKPDRREVPLKSDYNGFVIPDEFVVGYGLDYDQKYRNLPYVGVLELEETAVEE
ncbi:MAG: hypoxanthine phosphoribosyltransferase [Lachnospiraceae bacterium]|jgi:hypoxanthine phosphoribosyltransferase|nr:hypoxanthine phosphoribosyltransferase [Lachnospiraceae bacterium]